MAIIQVSLNLNHNYVLFFPILNLMLLLAGW
jgi:hypothetical protein